MHNLILSSCTSKEITRATPNPRLISFIYVNIQNNDEWDPYSQNTKLDFRGKTDIRFWSGFDFVPGPPGWGWAAPWHVPQPGQHGQEAGQRAGHPGGRHHPRQEARGDEPEMGLPQGQEHGHQVRAEYLQILSPVTCFVLWNCASGKFKDLTL